MQSVYYSWRIRDVRMHQGRKKKWRTLTWKMTEIQALAWASRHGFEIQRIEGSAERHEGLLGSAAQSFAHGARDLRG